jgi:tetratricopeptide (TPR) repeat protein
MAETIFINYRREDSLSIAGRLYDRLTQAFGSRNIFMDVDHIPAGVDFVVHLNNQVAACRVILVIIGPNWLTAKDESGGRRLDNPDDFVAIEIATALERDIRVVPVLVDGATMPKARDLPEPLKSLARRQAVEVRQFHFGRDAEALIERVREAFDGDTVNLRPGRKAAVAAAVAVIVLAGWFGFSWFKNSIWAPLRQIQQASNAGTDPRHPAGAVKQPLLASLDSQQKTQTEIDPNRKPDVAEQPPNATANADPRHEAKSETEPTATGKNNLERQQATAAEEERKKKAAAEEAEQRRLAVLKEDEDRRRTEAETRAHYSALLTQGDKNSKDGNYDKAVATLTEAIQLDPKNALAYTGRGIAYGKNGDNDRAIADYNEALKIDPSSAAAFYNRGIAYGQQTNYDRAISDFNEAIRIDPKYVSAYRNRGLAYERKGNSERALADFNKAVELDPKYAPAFFSRGLAYEAKGDLDRAVADFNESIRLDPNSAQAYGRRGSALEKKGEYDRALTDLNKAIQLDSQYALAFISRGIVYGNKHDYEKAIADFSEALRIDPGSARAFSNRGLAYDRKGDSDRAISDFTSAIRLDPEDVTSLCRRGRTKLKNNDQTGNTDIAKAKQLDASGLCR